MTEIFEVQSIKRVYVPGEQMTLTCRASDGAPVEIEITGAPGFKRIAADLMVMGNDESMVGVLKRPRIMLIYDEATS